MNKFFVKKVMYYLIENENTDYDYSLAGAALAIAGTPAENRNAGEKVARLLFDFTEDEADLFFHRSWHNSWTSETDRDKPLPLGFTYPHVDSHITRKKIIRVLRRVLVHGTEGQPQITPIDSYGYRRATWQHISIAENIHGLNWRETSGLREL